MLNNITSANTNNYNQVIISWRKK